MNKQPQFIKKRLNQIVAATVLAGLGMTAHAGEFSLEFNEIDFDGAAVIVDESGVASHKTLASAPASGLPNISFTLLNHSESDGDYYVRLRMQIDSQTDNDRVTMVMGVVRVTVAAGVVTSAAVVLPNEANYQQISVNATKQSGSGTTSLSSTIPANAAMIDSSGATITVQVTEVYNRLVGDNALFDDIIGGFMLNDHYDYKIGVEPVSVPTTLSVGYYHDIDEEFTAFPRLLSACSGFTVLGTLTVGNPAAALVDATAQQEDCAPDEEEEEDLVDQETIDELNEETDQLQTTFDSEVQSGTVSQSTVTQTTTLTTNAANATQVFANAANSGTTIDTGNALSTLAATTGSASLGSQVAAAATGTTQQQALITQNQQILTGTATVLTALATQGATLNTAQTAQVNTIVSNSMNTLSKSAEVSSSSPADLTALVRQANILSKAKADLGIAATAEESAQIESIGRKLATAVVTKVLTESGGTVPTQAEIEAALQNDPELLAAVIDASLNLPLTSTETPEETRNRIADAFAELYPQGPFVPEGIITSPGTITPGGTVTISFTDGAFTPGEAVTLFLTGESANGFTLALNGRQVLALTAEEVTIESDPVTGVLSIILPGESYSGTVIAIKSVPTSVPTGISFLTDGRAVITRSGYAVELAPTSVDALAFMAATLEAGYTPTFRPANGSFSLDLGGTQRFSGAFAYDNLTGKDLDTCGDISFTAPSGAVNSAAYAFVATCSSGTISQRITPFIDNADFFASLTGFGYSGRVDRSTGIITVTGVGTFKPSFFVDARTTADTAYYDANKNSLNMAFQGGDFNGDGKLDFKVISSDGVQLLYGVN